MQVDPFDARWLRTSLLPRARRVADGDDADRERDELFTEIWPWAQAMADRLARRLPAHADADEVRSRVLLAVWESTSRLDWDRAAAWPALLRRRIQGARADAARHDDAMTRRQRQAYAAAASALAAREQELGRRLRHDERDEVLADYFPGRPGTFASLAEVVRARESGDGASSGERADERWEPEQLAMDALRQDAVRHWLQARVPTHVAEAVIDWACRERAAEDVPKRLATRIRPYVDDLARLVGQDGEATDTLAPAV